MTRDEVKELLMTLDVTFNNFKLDPAKLSFTVNSWLLFLEPYSLDEIQLALKSYVNISNSAFAPTPSELIGLINTPNELANMDSSSAWLMVRKAISRSAYNSKEEFAKLPELVQKAVGGSEMLRLWAIDENYNNEVVMSLFMKNYKAICERESVERKLPEEARERLEQIRKDNIAYIDNNVIMLGMKPDKLQQGDFDYDSPQRPDEETLGHYAEQLRKNLGVN